MTEPFIPGYMFIHFNPQRNFIPWNPYNEIQSNNYDFQTELLIIHGRTDHAENKPVYKRYGIADRRNLS
jgi:hypothetical protein